MNKPKVLHSGRYLRLVDRDGWEAVDRIGAIGAVLVVAVLEGRILLVEQYRHAVESRVIELPAGLVGDKCDERIEDAAKRELIEETGYEADNIEQLAGGPISPGMSSEIITFVMATGLSKVGPGGGDESEGIVVHEIGLESVHLWLENKQEDGLMVDPKIYAGLHFAMLLPKA